MSGRTSFTETLHVIGKSAGLTPTAELWRFAVFQPERGATRASGCKRSLRSQARVCGGCSTVPRPDSHRHCADSENGLRACLTSSGYGVPGADGVVVTVVVGATVVVLVADGGDVVVGLPAGGTGAPVVSVTVEVLVDIDVEVLAVLAGARTAHATRLPASPVANVSASAPGTPFCVYRSGILAKLSASW